jgi:hypothetical protein
MTCCTSHDSHDKQLGNVPGVSVQVRHGNPEQKQKYLPKVLSETVNTVSYAFFLRKHCIMLSLLTSNHFASNVLGNDFINLFYLSQS